MLLLRSLKTTKSCQLHSAIWQCHLHLRVARHGFKMIQELFKGFQFSSVLKRKCVVLLRFTHAIQIRWHFYHVHSFSIVLVAGLTSDFLTDDIAWGPPQGPLSSLPQAFDHGATLLTTSRCCTYCNGPLSTILLACFAELQTLSTFVNCWLAWYFGKPNLWTLNVLSDGNKLTVNPFKSEKNPIPWFDTVIKCVAVISVMQVQSSSDSATRSTGESAAKPQVHLSLGPVPKQLPLCPRYNQRHHQKITRIRTNSKDLWRISVVSCISCAPAKSCYSRLHPCPSADWFFRMDLTDPTIPTHHPTLTASLFFKSNILTDWGQILPESGTELPSLC